MKIVSYITTIIVIFHLSLSVISVYAEKQTPLSREPASKRLLLLPYPFFNDTIGSGIGVAAIAEGYLQKQALTVGTGLFSFQGTYLTYLALRNYQLPWHKRVLLEPSMSFGKLTNIQFYGGRNPDFPDERAGSHDSSKDNFQEEDGSDTWFDFNIKYLLPIGHGRKHILPDITLENGIPVSGHTGGKHWNPLKSGRTYIELEPFYRSQEIDGKNTNHQKTAGIEVALTYDNTDFLLNPAKGNYLKVFFDRDWGGFDSSSSWSVWGGEFSQFFSLAPTENTIQRVIAFNFWTVDSPTWDSSSTVDGKETFHRPPTYKGANLGGLWRMRGYPATRFNDRAGIYYGLEYRHTLAWNPLKDLTMKGKLDVDWLQLVAFGELGRVAPKWELETLHEDMKWSAGIGLRAMMNNIILRFDLATSDEDFMAQLFIGQPWPKR